MTDSRRRSFESATHDDTARLAGVFLLASAAATVAMVITRVAADADQPTMAESLGAVADGRAMYAASAAARCISGVMLIAAAWLLTRTWIIRSRLGTPLVPYLLAASGALTVASGGAAVLIASHFAPEAGIVDAALAMGVPSSVEAAYEMRWITGKAGFAVAGAALLVAARYQWRAGFALRKIAPASAVLGIAMQFIWLDAATFVHPVVGTGFFVWLAAVGSMLATGRVERYFAETFGRPHRGT